MRLNIDDILALPHYHSCMRHSWLSLIMVIALATGGVANALALRDCPMIAAAAEQIMDSGHECCPDQGRSDQEPGQQQKMNDCLMGSACRTAPAMTPAAEPVRVVMLKQISGGEIVSDTSVAARAPEDFWRPPRTI